MEDAGDAGASPRRASSSSSSSGGGGLPVKRLREASPEDDRLQKPRTGAAKIEASPRGDRGTSEKTSTSPSPTRHRRTDSPGKSRTPSPKKQASPRAERQTPSGTPLSSARGDGIRRANTQPLTTEEKQKARSVSPPPVYVRTGSPLAATKCSTERQKIGRARALAAGVKKQTVEQAKSQITGSFLLEQSQASKELSAKQRREWMAAVKRTQDSSAKFVAQKRLAANNPSSAYERAQLIRRAQDDNWLDHLRAEDNVEVRSKTPPKAREKPPMPKSIASAIGPAGDKVVSEFKKMLLEKGGNYVRAWRYLLDPDCRGQLTLPQLAQRCRELGTRMLTSHQRQAKSTTDWAADWLQQELSKSPEAKESLQRACVRFDELELDRLASSIGTAVAEQLESYNRRVPTSGLPFLFVGGALLPENFTAEDTRWLQQACYNAGAQFMEPLEGTNMTWTIRKGARWLPPKNIGGRRWCGGSASTLSNLCFVEVGMVQDEHADPARNLYNEIMAAPGGGSALRTRISNPGQKLLRQDAKLDEPDKYGVKKSFPSWGRVDLLLRNVDGVTDYLRSRDVDRVRKIKDGQLDERERYGLPQDVLMWVYGLGRRRLMEELDQRQCHHKVISCIDVQGLREALLEELQNEQTYSPTRVIQSLSAEQLQTEMAADTVVPLLVSFVEARSPREQLAAAARHLLRTIRVVVVDVTENPDVMGDFGITRFPTLIWTQGRTGVEMARELGVKELPEPEKEATALLAKSGPVSRKFRKPNFERTHPDKHAAVRFQENVRTLWYALNGPDGDAAITLAEVDSETEAGS
eukprot:s422_g7.t2